MELECMCLCQRYELKWSENRDLNTIQSSTDQDRYIRWALID